MPFSRASSNITLSDASPGHDHFIVTAEQWEAEAQYKDCEKSGPWFHERKEHHSAGTRHFCAPWGWRFGVNDAKLRPLSQPCGPTTTT
jgi:hypothetical protein